MKRKICIVTGSRAEYGLLNPLLAALKKESIFQLQIAVTGMHLSSVYGLTYREILHDGFNIDEKIRIPLKNDTPEGITKALGMGVIGFASAFKKLRPDFVILLGDRYETYSTAIAAFLAKIPIIHLYGGELSEGAVDDAFRHSITKMSTLHFTATEVYRRRVIQLGEKPNRVFNVGALGIDNIRGLKLLSKDKLEKELNFNLKGKVVLVTFHPVTLENNTSKTQFEEILAALNRFKDLKVIFTKPNSDIDGKIIIRLIDQYVKHNPENSIAFASLGRLKYLSLMRHVDVVLGNSSSGIVEMPFFGKPTINIGDRQKGRIKAESVIPCVPMRRSITKALKKAFSARFNSTCAKKKTPYGNGLAAKKIVAILNKELPRIKSLKKEFYDLK